METAPLRNDLAEGPEGGRAVWVRTADGLRIRAGGWTAGDRGTVLLFTGRTEYMEKYGPMARALAEAGFATATCDWRGQGLADRVASDPNIGHVRAFSDYQLDVAALLDAVRHMGFPEPWHLLAHSMGGAIGLRALIEGLPVQSAVFSAPMWGIALPGWVRPFEQAILRSADLLGLGLAYAPGTGPVPYPFKQPFRGNALTSDRESYDWLARHIRAEPRLGLGGPSMHWLNESFREFAAFDHLRDVPCPTLALVGTDEAVVAPEAVRRLAGRWPGARAETIKGARHEAMMEVPGIRADFTARAIGHFRG